MYELLKNKKILSVEDNPDSQKYAECNLVKLNVNLFMASNGTEAIELLEKETFDIILMDLYMPYMNGVECIKKIRNEMKIDTPIIVMTAGLLELHSEIEPYINGSITKPYRKTELLDLMMKSLEKVEK